jgi:BNR/Asp-box repeat
MTELMLGTKKGLIVLEGDPDAGERFEVRCRAFPGEPVDFAMRDPASGRALATVTSPFYGPKIWFADDPAGEWTQAEGVALPEGSEEALERIWVIVAGEGGALYAGGDPGVLFESRDGGQTWELNAALREHRVNEDWQPGGGGLCLHSIVPWPGEPDKLSLAVSAAGVWHTEDRGETWRQGNQGILARYLPEEARERSSQLCVHRMERAARRPERMFIQFHGGVYRSDDAGQSWSYIGDGLPSDFGFPLTTDPSDPDSAYVIPLRGDFDRVMPDGSVRVYETRDGGASWTPRGEGLPNHQAYLTVLRRAFDRAGEGPSLQLYFGATSGEVFGSGDAGGSWFTAATRLPPVFSVTASA